MIGRWKLEGRTQTNHIKDTLTFPVNPSDDLFCQDLCVDVCVCVWLCLLCCRAGQRNYQSHAAGFLQASINQTEEERASRSMSAFIIYHLRNTHPHVRVMQTHTKHIPTVHVGHTHTYTQNRVMKAGRAESGVDSLATPAAAEMNGRAENCLHS